MVRPRFEFTGEVVEWRGPSPFYFLPVPDDMLQSLRDAARGTSYGWGVIPVRAVLDGQAFTTSLIPRDGTFYLPLKDKVRRAANVVAGERCSVSFEVVPRR